MKRLLLYVHFNKYNHLSDHVRYQIERLRPLFSHVVFISNSQLSQGEVDKLSQAHLIDDFLQRDNIGYDFAAWHAGMVHVGFDMLKTYDSVTVMNDTCFGPLWDMQPYYERFEADEAVDFWGMTNHQGIKAGDKYIHEHLQSYFITFKHDLINSDVFQKFWKSVEAYEDVQKVIDNYETLYTKKFMDAGFKYQAVLDVIPLKDEFYHSNFSIHYPHVLIDRKVPFIKIKTFDLIQHLAPYTIDAIKYESDYPIELIVDHMSNVSQPTPPYLIDRKVLKKCHQPYKNTKKVAVHLHTYYVDLLETFLKQFEHFHFDYDLFLTTDTEAKKAEIETILAENGRAGRVFITGNRGRDIIPMFKLKAELKDYDYIGHFHTKKSPEYPHWVGNSWRDELFQMLFENADNILAQLEQNHRLGLVIADIPSFFRYTKIVDPWNESKFAPGMNDLWQRMNLDRQIDFNTLDTFIMSYGTFIWFKHEALQPLFDLEMLDEEIPAEPIPQHTILHSIERILVYLAWAQGYDYGIAKNDRYITPFVDNKVLNIRPELQPHTYIDFNQIGGITGALKYIIVGPGTAVKYIFRRLRDKVKNSQPDQKMK